MGVKAKKSGTTEYICIFVSSMQGMEETFLLPSIPAKRIGMEVKFMKNKLSNNELNDLLEQVVSILSEE